MDLESGNVTLLEYFVVCQAIRVNTFSHQGGFILCRCRDLPRPGGPWLGAGFGYGNVANG